MPKPPYPGQPAPRRHLLGVLAVAVVCLAAFLPRMTCASSSPAPKASIFKLVYSCQLPFTGELHSGLNYSMQPNDAPLCLWSSEKKAGDKVDIVFINQSSRAQVLSTSFTLEENGSLVTLGTGGGATFKVKVTLLKDSTECESTGGNRWLLEFTVQ
jgi:hypothetical protein